MLIRGLEEGKRFAREAAREGKTIGTVHTLGALHRGHGELIKRSSAENDVTIVTVYPNKIQLYAGAIYEYDLEEDVALAMKSGATAVITSTDSEMFDENFCTYIWQDKTEELEGKDLAGSLNWVEAVTGAVRWITLLRPDRSYFGLKDIEQALLMRRAVRDLFIDCEIKFVPSVRFESGVPLSSRIRKLDDGALKELASLYHALEHARKLIARGEKSSEFVLNEIRKSVQFREFQLIRLRLYSSETLTDIAEIKVPFVISAVAKSPAVRAFDNIFIQSESELKHGPESVWLKSSGDKWQEA